MEKSFRGQEIPEVIRKTKFEIADSNMVIKKIEELRSNNESVTIEATNFDELNRLANVKLSTGDIIPVETAIALAQNHMLEGYTTGKTMRGGRVLRSVPSTERNNTESTGIYDLPRF